MSVTDVVGILVGIWILVAAISLPHALWVARDAMKDVVARQKAYINSGREDLAKLLVVTSRLTAFAFFVFLLAGLFAISPIWQGTEGRRLIVPAGLVMAEISLSAMIIYKQRVRKRILLRDIEIERKRLEEEMQRISSEMASNTVALQQNTLATQEATQALQDVAEQENPDEPS